jgi:hypothetical protein
MQDPAYRPTPRPVISTVEIDLGAHDEMSFGVAVSAQATVFTDSRGSRVCALPCITCARVSGRSAK